ncbi:MAG: 1-deoxy-D-xylulose-5-phosphate reductoisomerase [Thermodesulfobacteriota bacterium]|nr:1-deoxy-D-xylulose-5-phosphate reductoisomerase [Thermodesulfobacteriota bacterium]
MKRVVILGATGSIGGSALDVIKMYPQEFKVVGMSAGANHKLLLKQASEFGVDMLALASPNKGVSLEGDILTGDGSATDLIRSASPDIVINGITGSAGFLPSMESIKQGARLALANKESLVIGGKFITKEAKKNGVAVIPVDSEHSAIFQCLAGESPRDIKRIILTGSGGPFKDAPKDTFKDITPKQALKHPTWRMGKRITIDSATMMNKGLEIIEASWLFNIGIDRIDVVLHPKSIVHSMVEFRDTSIKAQMGNPDMRVSIAYALHWPKRLALDLKSLDLTQTLTLEFFPPDEDKFPAIKLAKEAMSMPDTMPCIMNAADEVAVDAFLNKKLSFDRIIPLVKRVMDRLSKATITGPTDLLELDKQARIIARTYI